MNRKITHSLIEWKNRKSRKPLLVRGARQVGKTYTIEKFGEEHFSNCIKINLEEQREFCSVFAKMNAKTLISELSLLLNTEIVAGESLFFIDEIQACPEAIIMLRYFYEQIPELHVVAAGSLLDHTLSELKYSMPVGRVEFLYMYPLSFKEYLMALEETKLLDYLESYKLGDEYSKLVHSKLLDYLRLYFFIGGMPEAVKEYSDEKKFANIERIQSNILTSLNYDFAKYGTRKQQEYLADVLKYSARNIGKKVKYVNISKDVRSINLKEAFHKLDLSRIIHLVQSSNSSGVPLSGFARTDIYKPLFLDIGLINRMGNIQLIDVQDLITINEGALAEQFVGQELLCLEKDYIDASLYYWLREKKNANAEVDYLYQHNNKIYPVEVKAGKSGSLKSLHVYMYKKGLNTGIRFNLEMPSYGKFTSKVRLENITDDLNYNLISLPLYMCFLLPGILDEGAKELKG